MKASLFKKLEIRLVLTVGLGLLVFALITGSLTYDYAYRQSRQQAGELQQQLVNTVRAQAEVAAFAGNESIAKGVINGLLANPVVLAVRLESLDGFVAEHGSVNAEMRLKGTVYPLHSPAFAQESIGSLIVLQNDQHVDRVAAQVAMVQALLMLAQLLAAVVLMAVVLRVMMIRPIVRLALAMGDIKPGSPGRLVVDDVHAADEIGLLAQRGNTLLEAAQAAIHEERALRSMLEATGRIAQIGGWSLDVASQTLIWSDQVYRLLEVNPDGPIDVERAIGFYAPAARPLISAAIQACTAKGTPFDLELPLFTASGKPIWARAQGQAEEIDGKTVRLFGTFQNISDRRLADENLRRSEERFSKAFHSSPIAASIARAADGCFIDLNQNFERDFGWQRDDLIGRTSTDVRLWPDESVRRPWAEELLSVTRVVDWQTAWQHKDGARRLVSISAETVEINGELCILAFIIDISARKQAEDELLKAKQEAEVANQTKSRFLAAASHDLRQPIQAINLFIHALSGSAMSPQQQQLCRYVAQSSRSLGELLNALLDISRLDSGQVLARVEPISVAALLAEIDASHSPMALEKSLRFILHFPAGEVSLLSDRKLLSSLLGNLIGNAIKYSEHGGVLVAIRRRSGKALIQVWDTGIGIAPAAQACIFDEYFQVGNPERDNAKGLGLGLAIVKRLAAVLETEIGVRSVPGKGSVFEFQIPFAAAQDSTGGQALPLAPAVLARRRVVLVEDDLMVAEALRWSFESRGMEINLYLTAEAALSAADLSGADFYVSDFCLPGLNGANFLDAVQQLSAQPIKAVLLTGETAEFQRTQQEAARWPVLLKPVEFDTLIEALLAAGE